MPKRLFIVGITITILGISFAILNQYFHEQPREKTRSVESVKVGTVAEYSTLILIAKRQGFFSKNGLDVTTIEYDSGGPSFKALLDGEVDMATAADFIGVRNSFDHQDFKIISSIFDSPDVFGLVARSDHGIQNPADLKGKKIGLSQKTMGEFFLGLFLTSHNLSLHDITQINGQPNELEEAITKGSIDAVVTFHPHIDKIEKKLGKNALKFSAQDNQLLYTLLYSKTLFVKNHPDTIRRFILALTQAQQYIDDHPNEMKTFFSEQLHYDNAYIENIISQIHFRVSLSESMLLIMEDEARWIIENKQTDKTSIPNYLDFIDFGPLSRVKPEAISIIR